MPHTSADWLLARGRTQAVVEPEPRKGTYERSLAGILSFTSGNGPIRSRLPRSSVSPRPSVSEEGLLWVTLEIGSRTEYLYITGWHDRWEERVLHLRSTRNQGSNQSRADMPGARTDAYQFRYDQTQGTEIIPISRRERTIISVNLHRLRQSNGDEKAPSSQPCSNIQDA